jgi:diaminopimelate epimerase
VARLKSRFYKYQALGNDMVVIDPARFDWPLSPPTIRLICNRHLGLGADGICYGPLPELTGRYAMRFFNPDGSEAEKSGNGLRIFARYLWDQGYVSDPKFEIVINGQTIKTEMKDALAQTIAMEMGHLSFLSSAIPVTGPDREVVEEPMRFGGREYRVTAVTIGNPHCVIFSDELASEAVQALGPVVETAPVFPRRTNLQLVKIINRHTIQIEIWERGAGYTLASGTSACATAGAALKTGRCASPIQVQMAGGAATVAIDDAWQVTLTGTVAAVYQGDLAKDLIMKFNTNPA